MNSGTLEQIPTVTDTREGPGQRLKRIRQSKNLELSTVAAELHLRVPVLQSLEVDAYDRLPEPVFVRGYLRSYARFLGLDERPILESYQERLPPDGGVPAIGSVTVRESIGSSHTVVRLITLFVVLGLITLVALWARSKSPFTFPEIASIGMNGISGQGVAPSVKPSDSAPALPPAITTPQHGMAADVAMPVPQVNAAASLNSPLPHVPPGTQTSVLAAPGVTSPVAGPAPETALAPDPAPVLASTDAAPSIWLEFIASSWLEIKDAEGKKLISGQKAKGERIQLEGKPPYWVVLGNSRAVQILVNGKPYDLSRHSKGAVARFSFDPKAAGG